MTYKRIFREIDRHKIISFDVYDTLLKRDVNKYTDVFLLLEEKLCLSYGDSFRGIAQKRIKAEKIARECKNNKEITFDEIYLNLECDNKELVKKTELEIEYSITTINNYILPIFNYCKEKNKRIIVISDMYLSRQFIEELLLKNGYDGFDEIFVSSEAGKKKRDGALYKDVLNELYCTGKEILHIGDNLLSDIVRAKMNGLDFCWIKKDIVNVKYVTPNSKLYSFINNRIDNLKSDYEKIGYEVYGPFILGFLNWVYTETKKKNIKHLFFASRDCYVLKQAFDILYGEKNIQSTYMYVSRRSLQVPIININNDGFEQFFKISSFSPIISNIELYRRMGFEQESPIVYIKQADIKEFVNGDENIQKNINCIYDNAKKERTALKIYLNDIDFTDNIGFVDIGWKCSSQKALSYITNADNLQGLYVGVHIYADVKDINATGYLFDSKESEDDFYNVMGGMSVIEAFFTAPHGTVKKYIKKEDGTTGVMLDDNDKLDSDNSVFKMQRGAMQFIKDYKNSVLFDILKINKMDSYGTIRQLISKPNKEQIQIMGNLKMENGGIVRSILPENRKDYTMTNYGNSGWKIGFLKKMFMIPLPYEKIFRLSYNIFKKKRG